MIEANDVVVFAFMAMAYFFAPGLLAKILVRASWLQALAAFPVFWVALFLLLGFGRINEEVFGWTLIMAMFLSWLGVPLIALFLKISNLPERLLSQR